MALFSLLAIVGVLGLGLLNAEAMESPDSLLVEQIEGKAEYFSVEKATWETIQPGMTFGASDRLRTLQDGRMIVKTLFASLQLEPNSEIEITKLSTEISTENTLLFFPSTFQRWEEEWALKGGEVFIQVKPDQKKSRFLIETETAVMAVRGTFFRVKLNADRSVDIHLRDGKLWVQNKLRPSEVLMRAGQSLRVSPQVMLSPQQMRPLRQEDKRHLDEPKQVLKELVALTTPESSATEERVLFGRKEIASTTTGGTDAGRIETSTAAAGPYQRDRLVAWKQDYFFRAAEEPSLQDSATKETEYETATAYQPGREKGSELADKTSTDTSAPAAQPWEQAKTMARTSDSSGEPTASRASHMSQSKFASTDSNLNRARMNPTAIASSQTAAQHRQVVRAGEPNTIRRLNQETLFSQNRTGEFSTTSPTSSGPEPTSTISSTATRTCTSPLDPNCPERTLLSTTTTTTTNTLTRDTTTSSTSTSTSTTTSDSTLK